MQTAKACCLTHAVTKCNATASGRTILSQIEGNDMFPHPPIAADIFGSD
jgi:hypothetical protein